MAQTFSHTVHVRLDHDKSLYKLLMCCGKHIAPNYDEWKYFVESSYISQEDVAVFVFVHAHHACQFALTWN